MYNQPPKRTEKQYEITVLKAKLDSYAEKNNNLYHKTHDDMLQIMTNHNEQISSIHTDNSFQRIFWESQLNAVQKPRKIVRWHPAIIKWCIFLRNKSSSAYNTLRSSCISLPSQHTLRDYTHFYKSSSGFSLKLDSQLIRDSEISLLEDHQKEVCIVLANNVSIYYRYLLWQMKCTSKKGLFMISSQVHACMTKSLLIRWYYSI